MNLIEAAIQDAPLLRMEIFLPASCLDKSEGHALRGKISQEFSGSRKNDTQVQPNAALVRDIPVSTVAEAIL